MSLEPRLEIAMTGDVWEPAAGDWVVFPGKVLAFGSRIGRQNQLGKMEPGEARIVVVDADRALDPHNPTSPYAGQIDEGRAIRLRAYDDPAGYGPAAIWRGRLTKVDPVHLGVNDHRAQITAVDALGTVATTAMPRTAMGLFASRPAVAWDGALGTPASSGRDAWGDAEGWWPMDEPALAAGDDPVDEGNNHWTGGDFQALAAQPPLNGDAGGFSWWLGTNDFVKLPAGATVEVPFTIGLWVQVLAPRAGTKYRTILAQYDAANAVGLRIRVQDTGATAAGEIMVELFGTAANSTYVSTLSVGSVAKRVDDNNPHYVVVEYHVDAGMGHFRLEIDGEQIMEDASQLSVGALVGPAAPANGIATGYVHLGADRLGATTPAGGTSWLNGYLDDLIVLNGAVLNEPTPLWRAATKSSVWESYSAADEQQAPHHRAQAVLDVIGWPASRTTMPPDSVAGSPNPDLSFLAMTGLSYSGAGNALELLLDAALAEAGEVVATRDGMVKFVGVNGRPSATSFTWDDNGLSGLASTRQYADIELERSAVANRWVVSRKGTVPGDTAAPVAIAEDAASIDRFGLREAKADLGLYSRTEREARRDDLLALTKEPASRIVRLVVNPKASVAARNAAMSASLLDLWRVFYTPTGAGYTLDLTVRIVGITHQVDRSRWVITFTLAPW